MGCLMREQKQISGYTINRFLGSGTMGRVYKVTLPLLEKTAALKVFAPVSALVEKVGMDKLNAQFIQEACLIGNIRHPNIVQIWHLQDQGAAPFYLMEYFCRNLGRLIGEGYWAESATRLMPVKRACGYTLQVLEGLARLHDAGIVHRDIKPFNLMIGDTGTIKIVDFGLSKRRGERSPLAGQSLDIGTRFYSAPEQSGRPESVDARADLYSVGVMLGRMLTRHFPGTDNPLPSRLNPQLDESWDRFILKATAPSPENRFQSAHEMSDDLAGLLRDFESGRDIACAAPANLEDMEPPPRQASTHKPRHTPDRIPAKQARKRFGLNALYQPETRFQNQYTTISKEIILDRASGLLWQRAGSRYAMQWPEAHRYVENLIELQLGGYAHWRLPTMEELLTLFSTPDDPAGICMDRIFSSFQTGLWSADTRSSRAAWSVDLEMGFVDSSSLSDYHFVKAVCGAIDTK